LSENPQDVRLINSSGAGLLDRVQALREQIVQAMFDTLRIACTPDRCGRRAAQADASIDPAQEHQLVVRAQIAAVEIGLDHPAPEATKPHLALGTIWHRRISSADVRRIGIRH